MDAVTFNLPWQNALVGVALMVRSAAFASVAPAVGSEAVPVELRAAFAFLLSILVAPLAPLPPAGTGPLFMVATELGIGLLLGFVAHLVLDVLVFAGTLAGYPTGLAMAAMMDPLGQSQVGGLAMFYQIVGTLIFLVTGGLRQIIAVLIRSYEILPLGTAHITTAFLPVVIKLTGQVIILGFRLAAPILVAGLLTDLCLMLVARAVPQMNVLVVGAPIRLVTGLVALGFSLHVFAPAVAEALDIITRGSGHLLSSFAGRG